MNYMRNTPNAVIYIEEGEYFYNFNLPLLKELCKIKLFNNINGKLTWVQKMTTNMTALLTLVRADVMVSHAQLPWPMGDAGKHRDKK
jgi:hypothetical protein